MNERLKNAIRALIEPSPPILDTAPLEVVVSGHLTISLEGAEQPQEPPYDPLDGVVIEAYRLWTKQDTDPNAQPVTVIYRTPDFESEKNKFQLALLEGETIQVTEIPEFRRVPDADAVNGERLVPNWTNAAERYNINRFAVWAFPGQLVIKNNGKGVTFPDHFEKPGKAWDGGYIRREDLRSLEDDTGDDYPPYDPDYDHAPLPDPDYITPAYWELWIPEPVQVPHDGYEWVQIKPDTEPRFAKLTVPQTKPLMIWNVDKWAEKELWLPFNKEWQWVLWRWTQLDSPFRSHNYHLWAFMDLLADHKAFTDLNNYDEHTNYVLSHFIDPVKYNLVKDDPFLVKISLATGGNGLRGNKNGAVFVAEAFDIDHPPSDPDAAYNEIWRCHHATQITNKRLQDGTMKTTNFPQGRDALKADGTWEKTRTSWPLLGVGGYVGIDWHAVTPLDNGGHYNIINLERTQPAQG